MKVVHSIPVGTFKYFCSVCGKGFNWDKDSSRYGKEEYKTITEQKLHEKFFCHSNCWEQFKTENNIRQ